MEKTAFELFYSHVGQHTSVGNYWNDPHHQHLYYKYSNFLPYVNNEISSTRSDMYKDGLLKLDNMILIGGPDDGVITPWQSSHFGYYDIFGDVVPMEFRDIYKRDKIGLKTLNKAGKLKLLTFPGVHHFDWHLNTTIIEKAILPYLDWQNLDSRWLIFIGLPKIDNYFFIRLIYFLDFWVVKYF